MQSIFFIQKGLKWGDGFSIQVMSKYDNSYLFKYLKNGINAYDSLTEEIEKMLRSGYKLYKWSDIKNIVY